MLEKNKMIFVSTSCLKGEKSVKNILQKYSEVKIKNIELGSSHQYENGILEFLQKYKQEHLANFIIHGYFPPKKENFVINLASQNKSVLEKSIEHTKRAISLSHTLGSNLYSLHAGIRIDPSPERLGKPLYFKEKIASYKKAFQTFIDSIQELCNYSLKRGVDISIENNVVSKYNLIDGKNQLLIMAEAEEFLELIRRVEKKNLGVLVDLGHLDVTSKTLDFDRNEFINMLKSYIKIFHLHGNDGYSDQHKSIAENSWALKILKKNNEPKIVIESYHKNIEEILEIKRSVENILSSK